MQLAAMRHRPESEDCFLLDVNRLRLRFHSAKNDVLQVKLYYADPYFYQVDADGQMILKFETQLMTKIGTGEVADHWAITLKVPYHRVQYLFEVICADGQKRLIGDRGIRKVTPENYLDSGNYFRLPYFHEIDRCQTPGWVKQTVWYQIFPERFANGDPANDPKGVKPWHSEDHPGRNDYYGGDLQGVIDHLDDLADLGVNGLYFCPIFKASSNHKYDTIDYLEIDPDFGDKVLFAKLVSKAHQRGMHIMLDAVFNHLGDQSAQWQDVLKYGKKSRFVNWFHLNEWPLMPFHEPTQTGLAPQYDTFAFEKHMPKLNTANPEVQAYLLKIATYWVKNFDIDAWRLDVANEVDHHFWREFRQALTQLKPDFYIVGEVWHSSQPWLNGDEFSGVMNYAFTQQIEAHFLSRQTSATEMVARLFDQLMLYRDDTNQAMLNMLDSHDTPRLLTLAHDDQRLALQTLAFELMQTGVPCLYYGTEMGMTGKADPDCRKPMAWQQLHGKTWQQVAQLVKFRRSHDRVLSQGITIFDVTQTGLIKVVRRDHEQLTAYFNTTSKPIALLQVPVLSQAFQDGQLKPRGYAIMVNSKL